MGKVRYWTADLWIYRIGGLSVPHMGNEPKRGLLLLQLSPLY